ncbi:MAG: CRISPR-associated protein Cas4 [Methanosarcinales archaeon]|nr:CRISPR-associated protein Cas4 [Methanosarcinales archaeon]
MVPVILLAVSLLLVLSLLLFLASAGQRASASRRRREYGIPRGQVVYSDLDRPGKALFSRQWQLSGKPDYIVRGKDGTLIPVEVKSSRAREPHPGHVMQLAAYSLLIEESYGLKVPFGMLVYADGVQHRVDFDGSTRERLLSTLREMRECLLEGGAARNHGSRRKCGGCRARHSCGQALK